MPKPQFYLQLKILFISLFSVGFFTGCNHINQGSSTPPSCSKPETCTGIFDQHATSNPPCENALATYLKNDNPTQQISSEIIVDTLYNDIWTQLPGHRNLVYTVNPSSNVYLGTGFKLIHGECIRNKRWRVLKSCFGTRVDICNGSLTTGSITHPDVLQCPGNCNFREVNSQCIIADIQTLSADQKRAVTQIYSAIRNNTGSTVHLQSDLVAVLGISSSPAYARDTYVNRRYLESYGQTYTTAYQITAPVHLANGKTITAIQLYLPNVIEATRNTAGTTREANFNEGRAPLFELTLDDGTHSTYTFQSIKALNSYLYLNLGFTCIRLNAGR